MGDFQLQPLRTLSDLGNAKRAARHSNDHSLAKLVTRKKKVCKSKKEAFQSMLLAPWSCQKSIPSKSVVSSTSTENQEPSFKPCQERKVQLFVNSSLTSPVCLQLYPSTTISALKGLLQEKLEIEPEKQHLFTRKNHELRDDLSLGNYGIEQDTNLELRLVSELDGGADNQKTEERRKTRKRQRKSGKKSSPADKKNRQGNTQKEDQVKSADESGDSPTSSSAVLSTTSSQSRGRKKKRRQQRKKQVNSEPSLEDSKRSTSQEQDDQEDSQSCSSFAGGSATDDVSRRTSSDDEVRESSDDSVHFSTAAGKPGKIQRRGRTKKGSRKTRKSPKVTKKSPSEEAMYETSQDDQAENKLVNWRDSSSAKTTAKTKHKSRVRKRTTKRRRRRRRRRRHRKVRPNLLSDESERPTTQSKKKKGDHSDDLRESYTVEGKPGKIQRTGKTKKGLGKTRKGPKVDKTSPSEEAMKKRTQGDQAENELVINSRDSTVSSSAKTTEKRIYKLKGRNKRKKRGADKKPSREEKKESRIQLFVISSLTTPVCLQLHPSTTISVLKRLLQDKLGVQPRKQHLFTRKNHELHDGMSLKELGIQQDTNLELRLVSGLMGGADDEQKSAGSSRKRSTEDSGRKKKGKRKAAERRVSNDSEDEGDTSTKTLPGHTSGETQRQKLEDLKRDAVRTIPIEKREATCTKKTARVGGEGNVDNSEDLSIPAAFKVSIGDPSRETQEQKRDHPRKHTARTVQKEKRDATKETACVGGEGNSDNSADSSISTAVEVTVGQPSGETQKLEQKGKRKSANKLPSGQQIVQDSGDSCSSTAVSTAASTSSQTVADTEKKIESLVTAGSEALDRRQDGTGCTPTALSSVSASSASQSKGRKMTRRRRKRNQGKPGQAKPDQPHQENLSSQQLQAVRDVVPSALQPAMQHPSTLCTSHSSDSIQSTLQARDINVPGSCNPVFLNQSSGHTFNYEFTQNVTVHQGATSASVGGKTNVQQPAQGIQSVQTSPEPSLVTDAAAHAAADLCEEALKNMYKTTGAYVSMIPWVGDDMRHMPSIFTKLRLVTGGSQKNSVWYEREEEVTYEEAFLVKDKEGDVINRIVYEGMAGMGKTTLIGKIAYDWAKGSGPLAKYKLVFVLKMSALEQTADLMDALFQQLIDPHIIDKNHLKSFIFKNPKKVLILLDGFDEFMTTSLDCKSFGSTLQILNRRFGADIDVLITTRTSHFDTLVKTPLVRQPFTHVKVLGFSWEDIKNYLGRFFSESPGNAESLFQTIQSSDVLLDLAHSPMLLLLMSLLWRGESLQPDKSPTLPETISRLFHKAFEYIFRRKGVPTEEIPEIVTAVGKVAFHGLVSPVQRLSFQDTEFEKSILDRALKAGILTSQRVLKGLDTHNNIQFIHKTFQEFSAAFYLRGLLESDVDEFRKNLDKLDNPDKFPYLLRFCCGDNEACTVKVFEVLLKRIDDEDDPTSNLALHCYFESQAENLLSEALVHSVIRETLSSDYMRPDDVNSFVWFLKHVANQAKVTGSIYLDKVKELNFDSCSLERHSKDLAVAISSMPNISVVRMIQCCLTTDNMRDIASSLSKADKLSELDISGNKALWGSAAIETSRILQQLKHLKQLCLQDCSLKGTDLEHIAALLSSVPTLVELDVSLNFSLAGSGVSWYKLQQLTQLEKLIIDDCGLEVQDVTCIAAVVGSLPNLVHCITKRCDDSCFIVEEVRLGFRLKLTSKKCQVADVVNILRAVGNRNDLVEVAIDEGVDLGGKAAEWSPALQQMKHLKQLHLRNCSLKGTDLEHIAASLSSVPTLVELDLSENISLAGSGVSWYKLQQLTQLEKLIIDDCGLEVQDVTCVAAVVGSLPNLVHCHSTRLGGNSRFLVDKVRHGLRLQLSLCICQLPDVVNILRAMGNRDDLVEVAIEDVDLGRKAAAWSPALQQLKHLKQLYLRDCSLKGTDLEHIAASLSSVPTLVELDLSENISLAGSGVSWSHLKCLKQLEKLNLSKCRLGKADIEPITASLSEMPNLVELDLYQNWALGGSSAWSHLKLLRQLEKLDLSWCSLSDANIEPIAASLSEIPNLVELDLSWNERLAGSSAWSHLKCLKQLEKLHLRYCSLHGADIERIAASFSEMPNLVELDLSANKALAGSSAWFHLKSLKQLKKLNLGWYPLRDTDIEPIAASLREMPNLVELDLSANKALAGSSAWSHLKCLKQLKKLKLCRCSLRHANIEHIATSLSVMPNLVKLDLSGNWDLAGSSAWFHLNSLKQLKKLNLRWYPLRDTDIEPIAASLRSNLTRLSISLSWNKRLAGSSAWSHLKCLKQLKKLNLRYCQFSDVDLELIAASLSEMPNLVELDLSGNWDLCGSSAWSHLKCLKQLEKLNISKCSFCNAVIESLAASPSEMPNLVQLDLIYDCFLDVTSVSKLHLQRPNLDIKIQDPPFWSP